LAVFVVALDDGLGAAALLATTLALALLASEALGAAEEGSARLSHATMDMPNAMIASRCCTLPQV